MLFYFEQDLISDLKSTFLDICTFGLELRLKFRNLVSGRRNGWGRAPVLYNRVRRAIANSGSIPFLNDSQAVSLFVNGFFQRVKLIQTFLSYWDFLHKSPVPLLSFMKVLVLLWDDFSYIELRVFVQVNGREFHQIRYILKRPWYLSPWNLDVNCGLA